MADNLDYWYDAQIRRYLTQFMRIFSGFKVSQGSQVAKGGPAGSACRHRERVPAFGAQAR